MMKRLIISVTLILFGFDVSGQVSADEQQRDIAFASATKHWFSAWELVSKDIYGVDELRPVEFIFFDDKYVYATSSTTINNGTSVKGCDLMNLSLNWKKSLHNNAITLPDKAVIPVGLMSFAAQMPNGKNGSFFVMPLPSYWKSSDTESKELGLENLVTGVFVHEFSHSQQMQNFGKKITEFENKNDFGLEFSDDVVQNMFQKDSAYVGLYNREVEQFYQSVQKKTIDTTSVNAGLQLKEQRHNQYFTEKYASLREIDDFFLTMEGLGQYSMYRWLTHPKGGNIEKTLAIAGVRRGKNWWSQDEGFALFLILDQLKNSRTWVKEMFGLQTESVVNIIKRNLR